MALEQTTQAWSRVFIQKLTKLLRNLEVIVRQSVNSRNGCSPHTLRARIWIKREQLQRRISPLDVSAFAKIFCCWVKVCLPPLYTTRNSAGLNRASWSKDKLKFPQFSMSHGVQLLQHILCLNPLQVHQLANCSCNLNLILTHERACPCFTRPLVFTDGQLISL